VKTIYRTFLQYKSTLFFIIKFIGIYVLLVAIYNFYLSQHAEQTDFLTDFVGKSVTKIFSWFHIDAQTAPIASEASLKLIINGDYVARIVEGCTAVSIIILFVSFVLAFADSIKKALFFALPAALSIFVFNIFRIVMLGYIFYAFPEIKDFSHRVIFPAIIYGYVVVLWIVFIKKINDRI